VSRLSPHLRAVLQALLVTFLWSLSFVLIKIGLEDIPALTFAGLRYILAFAVLLPVALSRPAGRASFRALTRADWGRLLVLGLIYYTLTQGAQFVALDHLPSASVSLMLNFSAIAIALLGLAFLSERLTPLQWGGVALSLLGAVIYFYPISFPAAQVIGLLAAGVALLSNATASVLGRAVNRAGHIPPLTVTTVSMGVGALILLGAGLTGEGWPTLTAQSWLIIGVLAVVNTAFAFWLWNVTLRTLTAVESGIINNTMLIQIAILAWIFLGEALDLKAIVGLILAGAGTLAFQLWRAKPAAVAAPGESGILEVEEDPAVL
jgi:drug/metabolite transporter (DMT)-like permease